MANFFPPEAPRAVPESPDASARAALFMDLQWFAAEDEGRTEEPSEYKIRKAREEGRVAKSTELAGALVLLLPAVAILFLAPSMLRDFTGMIRFFFSRAVELDPVRDGVVMDAFLNYFIRLLLPVVLVSLAAAVFANVVQTGFLFTTKPLVPDFSRILPRFGQYFQRIFSREGAFNLLKSVAKLAIIGGVAFFLIWSRFDELATLQQRDLWSSFSLISVMAIQLLIICALLMLALSVPDIMFQRWRYHESLKMSREEVKEERKMYEGDPQVRGRIRQRMRELMRSNMAVNVPRADVVVTNPTHYAVALEYEPGITPAPRVTAKGQDEMAFRIKEIARENDVPIVENKPLARALYAETEPGDLVPEAYISVVSIVYQKIMAVNEKLRQKIRSGAGA